MDNDAEAVFGETIFEEEDDTDNPAFESAKCGICTDAVIDRGVLDCCSHWFCFACIDNWAAITNLCPLCKNEFQLITCLPVYNTIGTIKVEEHSFRRDDDWCIQGNNNTLSFPSYYIDENAVICLDGDGCKMRSGLTTSEEDLTCDTSIACDSCDIWYHAFCVGFNPDCTSEVSWLCPRCIPNVMQQKSDGASMQSLGNLSSLSSADFGWISDSSFSGKVSVSVADAGETAVVVSMVEGEQMIESIKNSSEMKLDNNTENHTETSIPDVVSGNVKLGLHHDRSDCLELMYSSTICNDEKGTIANVTSNNSSGIVLDISSDTAEVQPEVDLKEKSVAVPSLLDHTAHEVTILRQHNNIRETSSALSFSEVASLSSCYLLANGDSKVNSTEDTMSNHCSSDGCMISSLQPFETSAIMNEFPEDESLIDLPLGAPVAVFSSSADEEVNDANKTHMGGSSNEHPSKLSSLSAKKIIPSASEEMVDVPLQEDFEASDRKLPENRQSHGIDVDGLNNHIKKRERGLQVKTEADCPAKKAKADRRSQMLTSRSQVSVSENSELCSTTPAVSTDLKLKYTPEKQGASIDILSIVRGIDHGSDDCSDGTKSASRDLVKRDTAAGPRVKKIMRIARGKNEPSILIQKLRKEIREAVQDKSNDIGKDNAFDAKLLTAFRAAIVEPRNELNPSPVSVRKSLQQKGKVRENLTKKIYGTSTGRRKRAWDRDWEIEFWKHRCKRINPEKVETLQSVLELLKKATSHSLGNSEMGEGPEGQSNNSILSRVYVADASVFPRKDDIKPLSAVERSLIDKFEENKEDTCKNMSKQDSQSAHGNNTGRRQIGLLTASSQFDSTGKRCSTSREASSTKGNLDEPRSKFIKVPSSSGSKDTKHNSEEIASQPGTVDKKKWALEVLARKNALVNSNMTNENQEDTDGFKEKYPLLGQLPTDMRPTLAPSHHNKIPVSVRQAHLYRLTEHYLRRTNLPVIRRTADTELAIADAVNIEKEIFGRSNSKLVYINLCSQSLSQVAKKLQSVEIGSCHFPAVISEGTNQVAEAASSNPEATRCSKVEEALKLAGLFSDSPPNSPYRPAKGADEENETLVNVGEDAIDNVLDIDSHPDLDIYGDFEYDLEDLGYIDSSRMAVSEACPENRDPKLKVVLSSLKRQGSDDFLDSKHETQELRSSEAAVDDHDIFEIEVRTGVSDLAKESQGGVYQEPSLAECEELYGPEKEPLVNMRSTNELVGDPCYMKMVAVSSLSEETENYRSKEGAAMSKFETESFDKNVIAGVGADVNHGSHGGEKSPTHSMTCENTPEELIKVASNKSSDSTCSISIKVEAYIKEHIRPLCKSGVITAEQYRWAVGKTRDKIMKYHSKAKNASFLIKEGEKVKKLALQYVEAAQQKKLE